MANLTTLAKSLDRTIAALAPGWSEKRARARLTAAQHDYLKAAYEAARPNLQRSPRSSLVKSESGQLDQASLDGIREWSRDTYRNNSIMSGFIRRAVDNIVGTGMEIVPSTSDKGLNEDLRQAFRAWSKRGGGWEASGRWSLAEGQRLTCISAMRDGDLVWYRSDLGWQCFEGGQIGTPTGYDANQSTIVQGVEINADQRPSYYWVAQYAKLGYLDGRTAVGLRADRCLYVGTQEWASQWRALPIYHNALGMFEDVMRYLEAELFGAMGASCIMGEINSPFSNALDALSVSSVNDPARAKSETNRIKGIKFAPGMVVQTRPNEKFTLHAAQRPSQAFSDYLRQNLRLLGSPIGLPLEIALMDFTQTNFAAAKMAITQSALTHTFWRKIIVLGQFLEPVYVDFIRSGAHGLRIPASVTDLTRYELIEQETAWLDELKQSQALNEGLDGNWDSITRIAREEMRTSVENVFNDHANEIVLAKKIAEEKGISDQWRDICYGLRAQKNQQSVSVPEASA